MNCLANYLLKEREPFMYDQEKIKKMKNHELAMEAYFYAYNHKLFGGATQKNSIKRFEKIIATMTPDERINLPFISTYGRCYVATEKRLIKCTKKLFGYKIEEQNWNEIKHIFYNSTSSRGALILDTVYGKVKIGVHRDGAGYACEVLRKLKGAAK